MNIMEGSNQALVAIQKLNDKRTKPAHEFFAWDLPES